MSKALANKLVRYKYRRESSSGVSFEDRTFPAISETSLSQPTVTDVKASSSPHLSKIVILLFVIGIVLVGSIIALAIVLLDKKDDGDKRSTANPLTSTEPSLTQTMTTTQPAELWTPWGDWTQCTTTCNTGIHTRYRSCNGKHLTDCDGEYIEKQLCFETTCPVYGKWSSWSQWGSCDATCGGGTQIRSRVCSKLNSDDLECVGSNSQNLTCSDWKCPDCSRICTEGSLNDKCSACECNGTLVNGRVLAVDTGHPLSNAAIYATTSPTDILTQSNSTGFFLLPNVCTYTELLVTRSGFVDQIVHVASDKLLVNMSKLIMPYLTETPQTKTRLVGENVTFCCQAVADPTIDYYEWFKDNVLLDDHLYLARHTLKLTNLSTIDSGRYQCRANSRAGAIMSPVAELKIKATSAEFCADALQQKTIKLPDDCIQPKTNTPIFEVGECIPNRCRNYATSETGTCRENYTSCCTTDKVHVESVSCSGYELKIVVIKSCRCAPCISNPLTVSGKALGMKDKSPLKFGKVMVNGVYTTYTSISGFFEFVVSKHTPRMIINIQDTYQNQFLPAIKVIDISDRMNGILQIEILMMQEESIIIDSSTDNTLVSSGHSPVVQISVPANSFYYLDGNVYNGSVKASLTFLDPTNMSVFSHIPGVFEIVNEEGQVNHLISLGVFNFNVKDVSGNSLMLDKAVDVYLTSEANKEVKNMDIKLWTLNSKTGVWEIVTPGLGKGRRRRQFSTSRLIGEIDGSTISDHTWFNFDYLYENYINNCFFKIRLFKTPNLKVPAAVPSINVQQHYLGVGNTLASINQNIDITEETCIDAHCNNTDAYISVHYIKSGGAYENFYVGVPRMDLLRTYEIKDDAKFLKIKMSKSEDGPFYNDLLKCQLSKENDFHFRFYIEDLTDTFTFNEFYEFKENDDKETQKYLSQMTWYPLRTEGYRICFIKVRILFAEQIKFLSGQFLKLKAISYGATVNETKGDIFGIREVSILNPENRSICIEYKCSGTISRAFYDKPPTDYTKLVLTLVHPHNNFTIQCTDEADLIFNDSQSNFSQIGRKDGKYEFNAPKDFLTMFGLYTAKDKSDIDNAARIAMGECRSGERQVIDEDRPEKGVAITFTVNP